VNIHFIYTAATQANRVIIITTPKHIKKRITSVAIQMPGNAGTNAGCAIWTVTSIRLCNAVCLYLILQGRWKYRSILV